MLKYMENFYFKAFLHWFHFLTAWNLGRFVEVNKNLQDAMQFGNQRTDLYFYWLQDFQGLLWSVSFYFFSCIILIYGGGRYYIHLVTVGKLKSGTRVSGQSKDNNSYCVFLIHQIKAIRKEKRPPDKSCYSLKLVSEVTAQCCHR